MNPWLQCEYSHALVAFTRFFFARIYMFSPLMFSSGGYKSHDQHCTVRYTKYPRWILMSRDSPVKVAMEWWISASIRHFQADESLKLGGKSISVKNIWQFLNIQWAYCRTVDSVLHIISIINMYRLISPCPRQANTWCRHFIHPLSHTRWCRFYKEDK